MQGWTQEDGSLWPVNALVRARSPRLAIDTDLLIAAATYTLSDSAGTHTALALRRPDAFLPEPVLAKGGDSDFWRTAFGPVSHEPVGPMSTLDALNRLLSLAQLRRRGWSETLVARFLGDPDELRANPYGGAPLRLYAAARVAEAEKTDEVKAAKAETKR